MMSINNNGQVLDKVISVAIENIPVSSSMLTEYVDNNAVFDFQAKTIIYMLFFHT